MPAWAASFVAAARVAAVARDAALVRRRRRLEAAVAAQAARVGLVPGGAVAPQGAQDTQQDRTGGQGDRGPRAPGRLLSRSPEQQDRCHSVSPLRSADSRHSMGKACWPGADSAWSEVDRDHLVGADGRHRGLQPLARLPERRGPCPPTRRRTCFARSPSGSRTRTRCSPTGRSSRTGPFIIIGFVRFTRCTVSDSLCRHTVTSSTPGPATLTGGSSFVAQATALRSSFRWSTDEHLPERAVDVPREVDDAPGARLAQEDLRDVRPGLAHVDLLHRQVGIGRDQRDGRVREGLRRLHLELPRAVDDPRRVLEPAQQRVPAGRLVLEAQVGVADRPRPAARERDAEELREAEVAPLGAPLVAERGLGRGHEAAAPPHEVGELRRTGGRRAPRRWAGRGSGAARGASSSSWPVVDHLERDAGLDERLVPAERRVLDPLPDALAAAGPRGLLGVDEPHAGERPLVAQVALGAVAPGEDLLDRARASAGRAGCRRTS